MSLILAGLALILLALLCTWAMTRGRKQVDGGVEGREAAARQGVRNPPGFYPQAISNRKLRRAALAFWHATGREPDRNEWRALRRKVGLNV
jgi:hypothetical protein